MVRRPVDGQTERGFLGARLKGVSKSFITAAGEFHAVQNVDLSVEAGEFVLIRGRSGSGKTTLINLLTGIDRPTHGRVEHSGVSIDRLTEAQRARWRCLEVGIVFQFFQLLPTLTVRENVELPMEFLGALSVRDRITRANELLDLVGVAEQAEKFPSQLSGGQQQRVAIARSLANDPPLIVADEPTGNLDSSSAGQVLSVLRSLVDQGRTLVLVSHERQVEEWADREILIEDGRVQVQGP